MSFPRVLIFIQDSIRRLSNDILITSRRNIALAALEASLCRFPYSSPEINEGQNPYFTTAFHAAPQNNVCRQSTIQYDTTRDDIYVRPKADEEAA